VVPEWQMLQAFSASAVPPGHGLNGRHSTPSGWAKLGVPISEVILHMWDEETV
jgi:hypothetical protein